MKSKAEQNLKRIKSIRYPLIMEGICVGLLVGVVVSFFRQSLLYVERLRGTVIQAALESPQTAGLCVLGLVCACILVWGCLRFAPLCGGSGIPQVKAELRGRMFQNWWRTILAKLAGGIVGIGAGLSLGREGPSIQLGAMVGKGFAAVQDKLATEEKLLMTCGAGAGLTCAFSAPLAGVVFTLEELHKNFSDEILLSTMAASIAADFVASNIFGLEPVFDLTVDGGLPLSRYWLIVVLGILLGAFGWFYNWFTARIQDCYALIPQQILRLAIPFALIVPLAVWYPLALGSGHALVGQVARGEFVLGALAGLLIMRFLFSMISFGSGAPGGIFLPLLVLGAVSGGLFAEAAGAIFGYEEIYLANFVIYGMVGYFAAIVRSPVTGVILITEMVGDFSNFLSLCIVAFVADITADLLGGIAIYDQLMERQLSRDSSYGMTEELSRNKVILEWDVYIGSRMDGGKIREMSLPKGCLVVAVRRGNEELVPGGETVLEGGDKITVLCNEGDMDYVQKILDNTCCLVGK